MSATVDVAFTLNGHRASTPVSADESVLDVLRGRLDMTGAKLGCGEGECGACTIDVDGRTVNACLMPAVDLDGRSVRTVEGLWEEAGMSSLQQAFVRNGAVQCGFCTPGMVMQASYLVDRNPNVDDAQVRRGLEGNVCRCTGYQKIVDAVIDAARGSVGKGAS